MLRIVDSFWSFSLLSLWLLGLSIGEDGRMLVTLTSRVLEC